MALKAHQHVRLLGLLEEGNDVTAPSVGDRFHAVLMLAGAGAVAAYWADWFTKGRVKVADDPEYISFEESFPMADAYLAACLLLSAHALWRGKPYAVPLGIAGGSAAVFLGLMDLLFDINRGSLSENTVEMQTEKAIIAACLTLGPWTMARLWHRRHAFSS